MRLKRKAITQYPFHGTFYTVVTNKPEDGDLIGDGDLLGGGDTGSPSEGGTTEGNEGNAETSGETILLETECDIQQAAKLINSGTIMADYKVFFPCEIGAQLPIRFNTNFKCEDYAIPINGRVVGLEYSQLGGCHVDIKMSEV
jgi:hypothetical protein